MAPKSRSRKPFRRSKSSKSSKKFAGGPKTVNATQVLAVPDRILLKLPYYEQIKWSGNTSAFYDFNLNSVYDPNRTGVGHQPLGYDQWGKLYNRYRVYGVTVRLSATNLASVPVRIGMIADNLASGTAYLSDQSKFEQPHMKSFLLGSANGMNTKTIKMFYSCAKINGSSKTRYNSDNQFQAVWNNNPNENIVGHVIGNSIDGTTAIDVVWDVHIIYHMEAFDRLTLSLSNTNPELRDPDLVPNNDKENSSTNY